jgi:hypothetical protein
MAESKVSVGSPGDDKRVFLDRPGGDNAKKVTVKVGHVMDTDVWEEVFPNNTSVPSFLLRLRAGDTVPDTWDSDVANFHLDNYGAF